MAAEAEPVGASVTLPSLCDGRSTLATVYHKILVGPLKALQLDGFVKLCLYWVSRLPRLVLGIDRRMIRKYLSSHDVRKLHIGSGRNILSGWLNVDLAPSRGQAFLDARRPFPFADQMIDYVYSEHMIEHLNYANGLSMLAECFRVLKPGGKLRLATPDLAFFVRLYRDHKTSIEEGYIKWMTDTFIPSATSYCDTFVINNSLRDWGHQFIYDEKVLSEALEHAGFVKVKRCEMQRSNDPTFRKIEREDGILDEFRHLETFILEAEKPHVL
jgi:predicted SAM-dependent methyltransferase